MNVAIVTVGAKTSTGTQDITQAGFGTPKLALFLYTHATSDDIQTSQKTFGVGATDGLTQGACSFTVTDNVTTTQSERESSSTAVIVYDTDTPGVGEAAFSAWITDGVRINWTQGATSAYKVTVVLISGAEITACDTRWYDCNAVANLGFRPNAILALCHGAGPSDRNFNHAIFSLGMLSHDGTTTIQKCLGCSAPPDAEGTTRYAQELFSDRLAAQVHAEAVSWSSRAASFTSTGFTFTPTGSTGGDDALLVALASSAGTKCGVVNTPTSAGNLAVTGVGFQPKVIFLFGSLLEAEDTLVTTSNAEALCFGVATATQERSICGAGQDNVGTTNEISLASTAALEVISGAGTVILKATLASMDSDGFTLNFSSVAASAKKLSYLALGEAAAGITLNPASGALTVSGSSAVVQSVVSRTVASGSLALTGSAVSTSLATELVVASGALNLSGQSTQAAISLVRNVDTGALTLAGQSVSLAVSISISTNSAAITIFGQTAEAHISIVKNVATGTVTIFGQTAEANASISRTVASGAVTFVGQSVAAISSSGLSLAPASGVLTLNGQAVATGLSVAIASASIVLQGSSVVADVSISFATNSGTLNLTGQSTSPAYALNTEGGALALTGAPASISTTIAIITGSATLTLDGSLSILEIQCTTESGGISVLGSAPTLSRSKVLAITSGSLVLAGAQPSVGFSLSLVSISGALTLAGSSVSASSAAAGSFTASDRAKLNAIYAWLANIDGLDIQEALRVLLAVNAGKSTVVNIGGGQYEVTYRAIDDTKTRVDADVANSARTSVTLDAT